MAANRLINRGVPRDRLGLLLASNGAVAGRALGRLVGTGFSETELGRIDDIVANKGAIITVSSHDENVVAEAHRVLDGMGALTITDGGSGAAHP